MPKLSSVNGVEPTLSRRSQRLLQPNIASEIQVCPCPISSRSSLQTHLKSPLSSVQNPVELVIRSANSVVESSNGSKRSTKKNNGVVGGFHVCRRSPRFSKTPEIVERKSAPKRPTRKINGVEGLSVCRRSPRFNTPQTLGVKNCAKTSNGLEFSTKKIDLVEGFQSCKPSQCGKTSNGSKGYASKIDGVEETKGCSPIFPIPENDLEIFDKKNCAKSSKINGVEGFEGCRRSPRFATMKKSSEVIDKVTCLNRGIVQLRSGDLSDCMKEVSQEGILKRKSVKRTRQLFEVISSSKRAGKSDMGVTTPYKGKEKKKNKKRNITCDTNGDCDNNDSQQCKESGGLRVTLTHLRTPLSSIEINCPKKTGLVCRGENSKKLVVSKPELNKSVRGRTKKTERSISTQRCFQGWTKDQELALNRAYLTAKPSPHFWKKVSKLVPGKSAHDCFEKIQSDSSTPAQHQPRYRSRANRTNSSPLGNFSLSGCKLLEPDNLNVKKSRNKRTKGHALKTARHLLQKQNLVNQGYTKDLFSILEPTMSVFTQVPPETKVPSTPKSSLDKRDLPHNHHQRSLSAQKKPFSRFRDSNQAPLLSPPVLKPIKNMAVHEKYIDQLHSREARRRAGGRKCNTATEEIRDKQKLDVIKAAKNALVSDASDMIKKFQHIQADAMDSFDDVDDSSGGED